MAATTAALGTCSQGGAHTRTRRFRWRWLVVGDAEGAASCARPRSHACSIADAPYAECSSLTARTRWCVSCDSVAAGPTAQRAATARRSRPWRTGERRCDGNGQCLCGHSAFTSLRLRDGHPALLLLTRTHRLRVAQRRVACDARRGADGGGRATIAPLGCLARRAELECGYCAVSALCCWPARACHDRRR